MSQHRVDRPIRVVRASRVTTMNGADVTAFATCGDRVVACGSAAELLHRFPDADVVDLGDAVVVPGLNDAHAHPSWGAESLLHADVSPERVQSRAELTATLAEIVTRTPAGTWVRAGRYDHVRTTGGDIIDRAFLDEVSGDHPILVTHIAGHWGVTNSAGLAAGGLRDEDDPPPGGEFGRDGAGRLTGVLYEQSLFDYAYPAVSRRRPTVVPTPGVDDLLVGLDHFATKLLGAGITSVCDALVAPETLRFYQEAQRQDRLPLRVGVLVGHPYLDQLADLGVMSGLGGDRVRIVGVKAFVDGAIAGRTCLLDQPFEGSEDHGIQVADVGWLTDLAVVHNERGCGSACTRTGIGQSGCCSMPLRPPLRKYRPHR
jgi:predicted amidohydrolase YtcJ